MGGSVNWLNSAAAAPYQSTIISVANNYGIDPQLLANQIHAESNFNPNAISKTGAIGLAQILPSTAANPGYGLSPVDPTDPYASIDFAAQYTIARGGYNQQGLNAYSGGDYSPQTINNILGSPGTGASPTLASENTSNDNLPVQQYNTNPLIGNYYDPYSGTQFNIDGTTQQGMSSDPQPGDTGPGTATGQSYGSAIQEFFTRIAVALVGLVVIGVALTYFRGSIMEMAKT